MDQSSAQIADRHIKKYVSRKYLSFKYSGLLIRSSNNVEEGTS